MDKDNLKLSNDNSISLRFTKRVTREVDFDKVRTFDDLRRLLLVAGVTFHIVVEPEDESKIADLLKPKKDGI